ncbi:MAG: helix-turn-helix domain-containing protein [Bavariicoccus seileri]|uniref:helix-turn-helix domain-containing protein n=1 Tax=Bavariicoccus seileri TaxID=549685 RepID=UPI003F9C8B9C
MPIYFQITPKSLPLAIESIGSSWRQEPIHRPHGYPVYHWLKTIKGAGTIAIGQQHIRLGVGQGILIPPTLPHSYDSTGTWLTQFVTFNGTLETSIASIVGTSSYLFKESFFDNHYDHFIDDTITAYETDCLKPFDAAVDCFSFLLSLSKDQAMQEQAGNSVYQDIIEPAIRKIQSTFSHELSVGQLAQELFISPQYLTRLFTKYTGKSTQDYITDYRLNKAKEYLINSPHQTISTIASKCGYSSPSRFSETFRKKNKLTPSAFRKLRGS